MLMMIIRGKSKKYVKFQIGQFLQNLIICNIKKDILSQINILVLNLKILLEKLLNIKLIENIRIQNNCYTNFGRYF